MTRPSKREAESLWMERLRERCAKLSECQLHPLNPPEPDFCAVCSHGRIGIEITEFRGPKRQRAEEGEQDGLVGEAQALYARRNLPPVSVQVYWSPAFVLNKRDRELAAELDELVARHLPAAGRDSILDATAEATVCLEHRAFERIWIDRCVEYETNQWESPRSWWAVAVNSSLVQAEINRKNMKVLGYREEYVECWLLLVKNGFLPSTGFEFSPEVLTAEYQSSFDRVLILEGNGSLISLNVRNAAS